MTPALSASGQLLTWQQYRLTWQQYLFAAESYYVTRVEASGAVKRRREGLAMLPQHSSE